MMVVDTGLPAIVVGGETMGGEPCVEGTRIPGATVLAKLRAGHSAEAIHAAHPTLPPGGVEASMAWARGSRPVPPVPA